MVPGVSGAASMQQQPGLAQVPTIPQQQQVQSGMMMPPAPMMQQPNQMQQLMMQQPPQPGMMMPAAPMMQQPQPGMMMAPTPMMQQPNQPGMMMMQAPMMQHPQSGMMMPQSTMMQQPIQSTMAPKAVSPISPTAKQEAPPKPPAAGNIGSLIDLGNLSLNPSPKAVSVEDNAKKYRMEQSFNGMGIGNLGR